MITQVSVSRQARTPKALARVCIAALLPLSLAGCGSRQTPVVQAITVTDIKGNAQPSITSITHGTSVYLDVSIANDIEFLGADWTVTCSSSLPEGTLPPGMVDTSCGTFAPYHTISGPVPTYPGSTGYVTQYTAPSNVPKAGTVTITAHATSLPSSVSTLTLTVN